MNEEKIDIRSLSISEVEGLIIDLGEKSFRTKQIIDWIWKLGASSIDDMTNISKTIREKLKKNYCILPTKIITEKQSTDKTLKVLFGLHDEEIVEGVLIPSTDRVTACISTQVGCAMGCEFCATGKLGFTRNLNSGEIFDQFFLLNKKSEELFGRGLTNVVVMGMGEPLMNLENLSKAIRIITDPKLIGMSPKRITVSSVGLPRMIRKFADLKLKVHFSISLHSAIEDKRTQMIPANKRNNLADIRTAVKYFHEKTGERITYEYILFDGINDSLKDASAFAEFCKVSPCKINIIEYNSTSNKTYNKSSKKSTQDFVESLEKRNIIVNVRRSRGQDINAACGQLAGKKRNQQLAP